jgi:hypothetical protein
MQQAAVPRIDLEAVDHHPMNIFAIDLEFDDGVGVGSLANMLELLEIEDDWNRLDSVTENDGRDFACPAQVGDTLADLFPAGRG